MKQELIRYTCDYCGVDLLRTADQDLPETWAEVENLDWGGDGKSFHFSSYECYKAFEAKNPDAIDCKASFYYEQGWWKGEAGH